MKRFSKVLIANRGEIAVRIIRTLREMGITSVAVYSQADKDSLHKKLADESICIGPTEVSQSYLNMAAIISAAEIANVEAIHPGYGFLSENPHFAEICNSCNIKFIGPSPKTIRMAKDDLELRKRVKKVGIPVFPSSEETEKHIPNLRHVEIQILADEKEHIVALGERDYLIQKDSQKFLEETPSPAINSKLRKKLYQAAIAAAKAINYTNAGEVKFLIDKNNNFYFLEMNTHLPVEHALTEMVTSFDLVKEQILIANGEPLSDKLKSDKLKTALLRGWAIECKINEGSEKHIENTPTPHPEAQRAEGSYDAVSHFTASDDRRIHLHLPGGPFVRVDTYIYDGYHIPTYHDSPLVKLIVWGKSREESISRMRRVLDEFIIDGIQTTLNFNRQLLKELPFAK